VKVVSVLQSGRVASGKRNDPHCKHSTPKYNEDD
jgi:hypothetical protein